MEARLRVGEEAPGVAAGLGVVLFVLGGGVAPYAGDVALEDEDLCVAAWSLGEHNRKIRRGWAGREL